MIFLAINGFFSYFCYILDIDMYYHLLTSILNVRAAVILSSKLIYYLLLVVYVHLWFSFKSIKVQKMFRIFINMYKVTQV